MLVAIVCSIIMLSMLDRTLRIGRLELLMLQTKHKLLALRDSLYDAAVSGYVATTDPLFEFFDGMLRATAEDLPGRHLPAFVAFVLIADLDGCRDNYKELTAHLARPENSRFQSIMTGFYRCVGEFTIQRHRIIWPLLLRLGHFVRRRAVYEQLKAEELQAALRCRHAVYRFPVQKTQGLQDNNSSDDLSLHQVC